MREESATVGIIGAAIDVHRELGPGLLESVYEECLAVELGARGLPYVRQQAVPLRYKGRSIGTDLRIDLLVADRVVVELKAVEKLLPIHEAQILTYLRLTGKEIGLLINFNVPLLKGGIRRFLNHPTLRVSVPPW
ncbi:MAG: GxxExxY protein [Candidatus Binatia bacterium]